MSLVELVVGLIVIGVLMGLLNKYGPAYIDAWFIKLINVIVVIAVLMFVINLFFPLSSLRAIRVGR